MVTIFFEAHSTTFDNESGIAAGWNDARLSPAGIEQAKDLGVRYDGGQNLDAVFFSDLKRGIQTVNIAFEPNLRKQFSDWRLRECNYGDLNGASKREVEAAKTQYIAAPFPGGESYQDCVKRMYSFLTDLKDRWDGKTVLIVGHRATQYGLEYLINQKPLEQAVSEPWQWQPGWKYELQ